MASIIKRKKNYSIVYTYVDENGKTKQKWETRTSYREALKRKAEIENQKSSNSFLPPTNQNIAEFLSDFVSLYGEKRWGVSMYDSQNGVCDQRYYREDHQTSPLCLQAGGSVGARCQESL